MSIIDMDQQGQGGDITQPSKSRGVLIVDDVEDICTSLSLLVAHSVGCPTYTAGTMEAALRVCEERRPYLVVLDLSIPERAGGMEGIGNGFRLLRELRKPESDYHPIIFVFSAHGEPRFRHNVQQTHAVEEYLVKEPSVGTPLGYLSRTVSANDQLVAKIKEYLG